MRAQSLKNAILQLAIQGKLVTQNEQDEPAHILLEKIRSEKAQLVKEKKIKAEKALPPIINEEKPFDIPGNWEWVRLGDLCSYIQRGKSPKYSETKKIPVISQKCNQWTGFSIDKAKFIEPKSIESYGEERVLQENDLLWNSTGLGTLGRIAIYQLHLNPYGIAVADSHVTVIRPFVQFLSCKYLFQYFSSPCVQNAIEDKADGSTKQKELATTTIKNYIVPLPPLAEQQRIVEKIEQLMLIVEKYDLYEQELSALEIKFPQDLKKSVLQYAVQGKLVQQNENDEPTNVLLEKIRAEKAQLIKDKKIKTEKPLPPIADEEKPFDIPESWEWGRLGDLCSYIQRGKSPQYSEIEQIPVVAQKCNQWTGFSLEKAKFIEPKSIESYGQERLLQEGDLLWNSTGLGTLGRMAMYQENLNPYGIAVADSHVTVVRPFTQYLNCLYLLHYFSSPCVQNVIENKADGSTKQKELATSTIKNYVVPVPPLAEQQRIVEKVESLVTLCGTLTDESKLKQYQSPKHIENVIAFPASEYEEEHRVAARADEISAETRAKEAERLTMLKRSQK
ncbi:restriction endonuclease subunit S [Oscillibacter sp.]|uniref:restriction endonuclease subunit S n=1 Tax=Oscillibacter sp. TaxID=1945593 RepID=UPI0028A8F60B|nr:restriction endonuclease subunit S [Oscillibacter sp.]